MDTPTFKVNQDGSIDLPIEGKNIRYVKESDLLAVKGSSEAKVTEWENEKASFNTQLAEANRLREETRQTLLQEQAAKELLVNTYKDYDTIKTRVGELDKELGSHKESVSKYEKELADRIRTNLVTIYSAKEDAIKDKTLDQLRNLEEAARIFGGDGKKKSANYDGGAGGPGGGSVPENPLDRAKRILEAHEQSGHRIGARGAPTK